MPWGALPLLSLGRELSRILTATSLTVRRLPRQEREAILSSFGMEIRAIGWGIPHLRNYILEQDIILYVTAQVLPEWAT